MSKLEQNITRSFQLAKSDILKLSQAQERIIEVIDELKTQQTDLRKKISAINQKLEKKPKTVIKTTSKKTKYVASKSGSKFHMVNCPFAQNIKPKSKVNFSSKTKALNDGYKPCDCVK